MSYFRAVRDFATEFYQLTSSFKKKKKKVFGETYHNTGFLHILLAVSRTKSKLLTYEETGKYNLFSKEETIEEDEMSR